MTTWNATFEASPADSDEYKYGASKIRELKKAISERLELEMNFMTGTQPLLKAGVAAVIYKGTTAQIAALTGMSAGALAWDSTLLALKRYTGAAWEALTGAAVIPSGTKMIFYQAAAPTGWVIDASLNDRVLRVVSANGANIGGSWSISGLTTADHILTIAEIPAHTHTIPQQLTGLGALLQSGPHAGMYANQVTGSRGGGGAHNHGAVVADGTWRPAYADVIICTKS